MSDTRQRYEALQALNLNLNMKRGQPSDADFDLSNPMLTIVDADNLTTPSGLDIRNYPGGVAGLPEARELLGGILGASAGQTVVGNNSSLMLMTNLLSWAMLSGLRPDDAPWARQAPKAIVTVPGYDRHFRLLEALGFELLPVPMRPDGPDIAMIEDLVQADDAVKALVFVPVYSNPTGATTTDAIIRRLARMPSAAPDFTIFADNAYAVHHLTDDPPQPMSLIDACTEAGNPQRAIVFGSTSKITFAGAGLGFFASSEGMIANITGLMAKQFIGPNKVEQYRHVKFLSGYPGGIAGLMADHRAILKPKFDAVQAVLTRELGDSGLATWSQPQGGYFVSLDTAKPVADRVVALAAEAGVALTPAGATYPGGLDPHNSNIRLAPSRPPVEDVHKAMEVVAVCVRLATEEFVPV